jgi:beta-carotene ketolase (CrtW type)
MRSSTTDSFKGIGIALLIMLAWALHLVFALSHDAFALPPLQSAFHLALQTFLFTGLFITAHDAMHGAVCRHYRRVNHAFGIVAVQLYALFSYNKLWHKHWEHHRHVATPSDDPDFHDGENTGFVGWYVHFLMNYIGWKQIVGMALVFNLMQHLLHVPVQSIVLFWVVPSLLSTVQLFTFGTYLPHREPNPSAQDGGYTNRHRSRTNNFGTLLSFLTCYHFGYHYEHHEFPSTPWWKLPEEHRRLIKDESIANS